MFRCPTCVAILMDATVSRCPSCGTNLRRHRPVELGQANRVTTRMSAVEHAALESRAHAARTTGRAASPAAVPGFTEPLSLATDEGPPADIDLREHDVDVDVTVSEQPARD
jgi:hypothetical protein